MFTLAFFFPCGNSGEKEATLFLRYTAITETSEKLILKLSDHLTSFHRQTVIGFFFRYIKPCNQQKLQPPGMQVDVWVDVSYWLAGKL
mgnify:CR=1 FL=1